MVTIGKFDGRHQGHQKLLKEMLQQKENHGWKTAVFTFDMAPIELCRESGQQVITTNEERRNNMRTMGMDYLVEYPFQSGSGCHVTGRFCHRGAGKADACEGRGGRTGLQLWG